MEGPLSLDGMVKLINKLIQLEITKSDSVNECKNVYKRDWVSTLMKIHLDLGMWMLKIKANGLFSNCKEFLETSAKIKIESSSLMIPHELNSVDNQNLKFSHLNPNLMRQTYKSVIMHADDVTKEKIQTNNLSSAENVINNFIEMICEYCHDGQFKSKVSN